MLPLRSKWRANGGPQLRPNGRWGESRKKSREDNDGGAGGNRKECQTNHLTKEVQGGMQGRGVYCKVCGQHSAMNPWV